MRTQRQANRSKVNRSSATRRISTTRIPMKGKGVNHLKRDPRTPSQRERVYPLTKTTQATTAHLRARVTSVPRSGTTSLRNIETRTSGKIYKDARIFAIKGRGPPKKERTLTVTGITFGLENVEQRKLRHVEIVSSSRRKLTGLSRQTSLSG